MKRIISLLLIALILVGCGSPAKEINYISSVDAMTKMDNQDSFFMIIGNSTCSACQVYKPVLEELVKNKGADLFYVETDTEAAKSDTDYKNVLKFFEEYLNDEVKGTPATLYVEDGKVETVEIGIQKYTDLISWIESKK